MTTEIIDEEDWEDLTPVRQDRLRPKDWCGVGISKKGERARAYVCGGGAFAQWLAQCARYRVQLGGRFANHLRLIADFDHGPFVMRPMRGDTRIVWLGPIAAWPWEARDRVAAKWEIRGASLLVTLPEDFARPSAAAKPASPSPAAAAAAAPSVASSARGAAVAMSGDPPSHRSALAARRIGK